MSRFSGVKKFSRWAFRLVVAAVLIGGWALALLAVHVVVVPDAAVSADARIDWKLVVVPKNRLGVSETYVDTRGWGVAEAAEHEALVARLVEAGKADAMAHVIDPGLRQKLDVLSGRRSELFASAAATE